MKAYFLMEFPFCMLDLLNSFSFTFIVLPPVLCVPDCGGCHPWKWGFWNQGTKK